MTGGDGFQSGLEPGVGFDAVQLRRLDERGDTSPGGGAFVVSDAGGAPGFQVDAGLKFQGSSSSMRLLGCPTAIASRVKSRNAALPMSCVLP